MLFEDGHTTLSRDKDRTTAPVEHNQYRMRARRYGGCTTLTRIEGTKMCGNIYVEHVMKERRFHEHRSRISGT